MSTASILAEAGLELPPGYTIVSADERPDLDPAIDELLAATWPAFMNEDEVANAHFGRAYADWPQFQSLLLDKAGTLVALGNAMPLAWDGTDEGLPAGWREQVLQSVADLEAGRPMNTLGAMQIAMRGDARGAGLSGTMVGAMRAGAKAAGYRAVIACVQQAAEHRPKSHDFKERSVDDACLDGTRFQAESDQGEVDGGKITERRDGPGPRFDVGDFRD